MKKLVMLLAAFLLGSSVALGDIIEFNAPVTLKYDDVYNGKPGFYVTVSASADSTGYVRLLADGTETYLGVWLTLTVVPPEGSPEGGGLAEVGVWFNEPLTAGETYTFAWPPPSLSTSASAQVFLPDEGSVIPVSIQARTGWTLAYSNRPNDDWNGPATEADALVVPVPASALMGLVGLGALAAYRKRRCVA